MTIRTGMITLVSTARGMANAGTAEWTVAGESSTVSYWSDEEIQRVLDRHKVEYIHADLQPIVTYSGGAIVYTQYRANIGDIESGATVFKIEDTAGTVSGYTFDYALGIATFATDQAGKAFWWSGFGYDLNAAAADIWRLKASHAAEMVDWATDGHNVKRSQQVKACLDMATFYQARSFSEAVNTVKIVRNDL